MICISMEICCGSSGFHINKLHIEAVNLILILINDLGLLKLTTNAITFHFNVLEFFNILIILIILICKE